MFSFEIILTVRNKLMTLEYREIRKQNLSLFLTPYTLTSVCIFSILFLMCWQGEFV